MTDRAAEDKPSARRGRWLVATVAGGTACLLVGTVASDALEAPAQTFTAGARTAGGLAVYLGVCWLLWRGSIFAHGLFTALSGVILLGAALVLTLGVFLGGDRAEDSAVGLAVGFGAACSAFVLWVLLISRDAGRFLRLQRVRSRRSEAEMSTPAIRRMKARRQTRGCPDAAT